MLKKLMKYEWMYIWKKALLFALVLVAASLLGYFSAIQFSTIGSSDPTLGFMVGTLGFFVYYTVLIGAVVGFSIIVAIRFYKAVYGDAGYVTHTLPVSARQIYCAHLIVYGLCTLVLNTLMMVSISIVTNTMFDGIFSTEPMPPAFHPMSLEYMEMAFGLSGAGSILMLLLFMALGAVSGLLMIYAAIVMGQYWKRYKVWGAVVSYIILYGALTIVSMIITIPYMVISIMNGSVLDGAPVLGTSFWMICLVLTTVFCIVTYFIMDHGMTKRLNLE